MFIVMSLLRTPLVFLPGAAGLSQVWTAVAANLQDGGERHFVAYPGFGTEPPDSSVRGLDDLLQRLLARFTAPINLLAQSMGGLLALQFALAVPNSCDGWCCR